MKESLLLAYLFLSFVVELILISVIMSKIRAGIFVRSNGVLKLIPRKDRFITIKSLMKAWWIIVFLIPLINLLLTLSFPLSN